ncbi:MAG: (Fe-S)-binding protein, partial [Dehalococcoidia bacterium]|nr:(Fe-S)-binding protein [Dehalococcoidia bacterium]
RTLGDEVQFNPAQTCCGQPAFNSGYWNEAKPLARRLLSQYDGSEPVVLPSGSCAAMIRNYYHELFADDPVNQSRADRLSRNVYEFTEYVAERTGSSQLDELLSDGRVDAKVAFHEACHAKRELGVDAQPKRILEGLADRVELPQAEVCCGFGGTFSVKYSDISGAMLSEKLDNIEASGADVVTACDSSCLMHIRGGLQRRGSEVKVVHIAELVAAGLEGR